MLRPGLGEGLELMEKEFRGHIIGGLGGHNRESAFPLSEIGTPGVLEQRWGHPLIFYFWHCYYYFKLCVFVRVMCT